MPTDMSRMYGIFAYPLERYTYLQLYWNVRPGNIEPRNRLTDATLESCSVDNPTHNLNFLFIACFISCLYARSPRFPSLPPPTPIILRSLVIRSTVPPPPGPFRWNATPAMTCCASRAASSSILHPDISQCYSPSNRVAQPPVLLDLIRDML